MNATPAGVPLWKAAQGRAGGVGRNFGRPRRPRDLRLDQGGRGEPRHPHAQQCAVGSSQQSKKRDGGSRCCEVLHANNENLPEVSGGDGAGGFVILAAPFQPVFSILGAIPNPPSSPSNRQIRATSICSSAPPPLLAIKCTNSGYWYLLQRPGKRGRVAAQQFLPQCLRKEKHLSRRFSFD
jgi:hypothetical protein